MALDKKTPENLLNIMGCRFVPAVYTGNAEEDNRTNTELYLHLVNEGKNQGFCPVLVDKDIKRYVRKDKYGFTDSKEDYPKVTKRLIDLAAGNCFSVWMGRLIYNYYLDCDELEDDVENDLNMLIPPDTKDYLDKFAHEVKEKEFVLGEDNSRKPYNFSFENHVFALIPVENPWEVLAWVPMGGFNWCPDELHQIALSKGLFELFGARIMYISYTSLEYYLPEPLTRQRDVEKAAKILIAADNDVYEDYEVAADMVVSKVAYLIGIRKSFFENVHESPQMEWYERLEQDKNARIVRNLCRLRAEIERNYGEINKAMYYDLKNLNSLPDLVPQECIDALSRDGISLIRANYKLNQYIIDLNRHINNRVNNVRSLFPIWLKWDYIKELFIMPNGMTEAGIKAAANEYYANKRSYPYQTYLNWPGAWSGNILYNDKRFVTLLYEAHEDYFTDISKVTDAGNVTKNGIYDFLDDSERTAIMVDCENSNPYKLYAMLESLDQEALLSKISKIMLFDDSEHTTPAWKVLERFTEIPIQHQTIKRLMDHKSLVDPIMMAMTVKEYYANQIDSFILLSSDSDYWALIETLPEARYIVMVEESKVGQAIKTALENAGVTYCYIDDFNTANNATLQLSVILSEVQQVLAQSVQLNMKDVMSDLYQRLHIDLSTAEKDQIYNRYIRPMRLVLDPDGNVTIELGRQ